MSDVQLTSESLPYVMVQLSVSVRSHRVGLLALFATPVIGAESGKAQLASRGRAPAFERMRLVRDDVANDVEDLREPCGRRDCTAADIESARRCNAASVRAHSPW